MAGVDRGGRRLGRHAASSRICGWDDVPTTGGRHPTRPARRSAAGAARQAGEGEAPGRIRPARCGFGAGAGCGGVPGCRPTDGRGAVVFSFGGRSVKSFSNSSESTVSSATSFSARAVEPVAVGGQDLRRPLVRLVDDRPDLLVDRLRDLVGVVALLADLAAEEDELVALPEGQRAELRSCRTR